MIVTLMHPSFARLQRFADRESTSPRIAKHLARCPRCRARVAELRSLTAALRDLPSSDPQTDLLARIQASRAAGVRVVLPAASVSQQRAVPARVAAGVAAVLLLVWFVASRFGVKPDIALSPWPTQLFGQEPGTLLSRASYPVVRALEPTRIVAGRWTYANRTVMDGIVTDSSTTDTLTVGSQTVAGAPVWVISNVWGVGSRWFVGHDTLVVRRQNLMPLRRVCCRLAGKARDLRYAGNQVGPLLLAQVAPEYRGTPLREDVYPTIGLLNFLYLKPGLQALPLTSGWHGSVYTIWGSTASGAIPLDLRVLGMETITVAAGRFDCWRVQVSFPRNRTPLLVWVARDGRGVIRVEQRMPDGFQRQDLVSITPPAP